MDKKELYNDVIKKSDIVKVISSYIPLEKKGKNYTCLCPFHDDKSLGNFYVSEDKQIYSCFSCGAHGNVITFVKEYEHLDNYIDVCKRISSICGFTLPEIENYKKNNIDKEKECILKILQDIEGFYCASLYQTNEAKKALEYLYNRGLNDDIIKKFKIGYCLEDGKVLIEYLKKKGYSIKDISKTGIVDLIANPVDKNAGRISFPIANLEGNVVGFSCRAITNQKVERKYLNTNNTKVFNKSSILYNFYNALNEIRKKGSVYIFEGFMDAIAAYRANFKNSIALMGTALTSDHLKILKKLDVQVNLCLDLDDAGQNAMLNIVDLFEKYNISYKLVNNKVDFKYKDSDEIIFNLKEKGLEKYLLNLIDKPEWLLNYYSKKYDLNNYDNKIKLLESFSPIIEKCNERVEYENYLQSLIYLTNFTFEAIDEFYKKRIKIDFNSNKKEIKNNNTKKESIISNDDLKINSLQKTLLRFSLINKNTINDINSLNIDNDIFSSSLYEDIFLLVCDYYNKFNNENIKKENFIEYAKLNNKNDEFLDNLENIYNLKTYNDYSKEFIVDVVNRLNKTKENKKNKEIRYKLAKNSDTENDKYILTAMINVKKNEK